MAKATLEDLAYIKVRSVLHVDTIYDAVTNERIATVSCHLGKPATVHISPAFLKATTFKWKQVFEVYTTWKRNTSPHLKIPDFAGMGRPQGHKLKDGSEHPWRKKPIATKVKPNEQENTQDNVGRQR